MSIDSIQGKILKHDLYGKEFFAAIKSSETSVLERLLKLDEVSKEIQHRVYEVGGWFAARLWNELVMWIYSVDDLYLKEYFFKLVAAAPSSQCLKRALDGRTSDNHRLTEEPNIGYFYWSWLCLTDNDPLLEVFDNFTIPYCPCSLPLNAPLSTFVERFKKAEMGSGLQYIEAMGFNVQRFLKKGDVESVLEASRVFWAIVQLLIDGESACSTPSDFELFIKRMVYYAPSKFDAVKGVASVLKYGKNHVKVPAARQLAKMQVKETDVLFIDVLQALPEDSQIYLKVFGAYDTFRKTIHKYPPERYCHEFIEVYEL